jgi:hypothetical protein
MLCTLSRDQFIPAGLLLVADPIFNGLRNEAAGNDYQVRQEVSRGVEGANIFLQATVFGENKSVYHVFTR